MAEFKIPKIRFRWRGNWTSAQSYRIDDIVLSGGKSYVCVDVHTSTNFESDYDNSVWEKVTDGVKWRNLWTTTTVYILGDIVSYGGKIYRCIANHTSSSALDLDFYHWSEYAYVVRWRDNWNPGTTYIVYDIVHYGGIVYRCITTHTSGSTFLSTDISKWEIYFEGEEYRDDWDNLITYKVNDLVKYGSSLYRCSVDHISGDDSTINFDDNLWALELPGQQFMGVYSSLSVYAVGDLVLYGGYLYVALKTNENQDPILPTGDWIVVQKGYNLRGDWSFQTDYKVGDVVRKNGLLYKALDNINGGDINTVTYTVTIGAVQSGDTGGFKYYIDGQYKPQLDFSIGTTYIFNQNDLTNIHYPNPNGGATNPHPLNFSANNLNGEKGGGTSYIYNVVYKLDGSEVTQQQYISGFIAASTRTVSITVDLETPSILYYWCWNHNNMGNTISTTSSNVALDPNESASWELLTQGVYWRGIYTDETEYSINDIVYYRGNIYKCLVNHLSDIDWSYPENGSGVPYWELYSQGGLYNGLARRGDLLTYNTQIDGSTLGPTNISVGTENQLLMVNDSQEIYYKKFGIINKVYYVSPLGVDAADRGVEFDRPWKTIRYATENITGPASIFVRTGTYYETLPIIIPAEVAVIGEELRSTTVSAAPPVAALALDSEYTIIVLERIKEIISDIIQGTLITKTSSNTQIQNNNLLPGSSLAGTSVENLIDDIIDYIDYHINSEGSNPSVVGTNTAVTNTGYTRAISMLTANTEFLAEEAVAFMQTNYSSYAFDPDLCKRDVRAFITAWKYDIIYTGNYKSLLAARYYKNAILGSELEDMFYLRNSCGLRNMTLKGLNGTLLPGGLLSARRPTAGAYVSLDPGWGPADDRTWITTRSPYVQNVTTFGNGCIGQKIDGSLHNGGNKSIVSNDFTQILSDGIGAWVTNNARAELVSVFTYYNHIGYLSELGGKIRATNGNNSYGNFGSVAIGYDPTEVTLEATVDGRTSQAIVNSAMAGESSNEILALDFLHAGENYNSATFTFVGSGTGVTTVADEFRDDGVFEVRLINPEDSTSNTSGGTGYLLVGNNAQAGDSTTIVLSSNDQNTITEYNGMRLIIISGTGVGQYGYIYSYNSGTKIATVYRESDDQPGWDNVLPGSSVEPVLDTTTLYRIEPRVTFSHPGFTGSLGVLPSSSNWSSITYGNLSGFYTDVQSEAGTGTVIGDDGLVPVVATFDVTKVGNKYTVVINNSGAGYSIKDELTIIGSSVGGVSPDNDITITVTRTSEDSTNSILNFNYEGTAFGGGFVAIAGGSNAYAFSTDGLTWSNPSTLPASATWTSVSSGNISNTGYFVAVSSGGTQAAYSTNGTTWSSSTLPASASWTSVAYGNSRFVAVASGSTNSAVSNNGSTWISGGALPSSASWSSVTYGKGIFVAVSTTSSTSAAYSTNGTSWTAATLPASANWTSVSYGNNRFVAIASGGTQAAYSFDGITWTSSTLPSSGTWSHIKYGQGLFFAVRVGTTAAATSEDGVVWTARVMNTSADWSSIAFGNPNRSGTWVAVSTSSSTVSNKFATGTRAKGRATVENGSISYISLWEPGSGYLTEPTVTLTDPNNISEIFYENRVGKGVLANPTFTNRGTGYKTSTTDITVSGDGYADKFVVGSIITVDGLSRYPRAGANINLNLLPTTYKIVTVTELGGPEGYYKARFRIAPTLRGSNQINHDDSVQIREQYSQIRLTNHDFLDIGSGNFEQSNYPSVDTTLLAPENEVFEEEGGRVFYTSTDQDGNFRVGELFAVEQATGTVTISADFFDLQGLSELSLGGVRLGGSGAVIREFSTDPTFTADSNNIVPTQRAIKTYLAARLSTGGSEVSTGIATAGLVRFTANRISTTTGTGINFTARADFNRPTYGTLLAMQMFMKSFKDRS